MHEKDANYFEMFGLPLTYRLDKEVLMQRYRALQQSIHPDNFIGEPAALQHMAQQYTAEINTAYRVLCNPMQRANYWLSVKNVEKKEFLVESTLLMECMELREMMENARTVEEKRALCHRVQVDRDAAIHQFEEKAEKTPPDTAALWHILQRWKYMEQLVQAFQQEEPSL